MCNENKQKATEIKMQSVVLLFLILSHIKPKANDLVLASQTLVIFVMIVMFLKLAARTCKVCDFLNYTVKRHCSLSLSSAIVHLLAISPGLNQATCLKKS